LIYKRVVKAIRKEDSNHMIFLNGSVWSNNFDVFEEQIDDNIVYEFHKYWFKINQKAIQVYLDFRDVHEVPIFIGETGENSNEWVRDFRLLLDSNTVGWCFWPYKKMNNTRGIMNFVQPGEYHLITEYAKSDRCSYRGIRENRPDPEKVQAALNEFLENSLFTNNYPNEGYIEALGFNPGKE
jgi:endoglucanase